MRLLRTSVLLVAAIAAHRRLRVVPARESRRAHHLRGHARHEHAAPLPLGRSGDRPNGIRVPSGRDRGVLQRDPAHHRVAPHRRRARRAVHLQGRQQRLRRPRPPDRERSSASSSRGCPTAERTERSSPSPSCSFPRSPSRSVASRSGPGGRAASARDGALPHRGRDARTRTCTRPRATRGARGARGRHAGGERCRSRRGHRVARAAHGDDDAAAPYRQHATIGYSGAGPRGAVYPDGRIHTGDPLFTKIVKAVDVDLHFAFTAAGADRHAVHGTSRRWPTSRAQRDGTASSCSHRRAVRGRSDGRHGAPRPPHAPANRAGLHERNRPRHARHHIAGHVEVARAR